MSHDPLCSYFPDQLGFGGIGSNVPSTQPFIAGGPCICDVIARAERRGIDRAGAALAAYFDDCVRMMTDGSYSYFVPVKAEALDIVAALNGGENSA